MRGFVAALLLAAAAWSIIPAASASTDPCGLQVVGNQDTGIYTTEDCRVVVSSKPYDCVWGGHWTETSVGPVTYRSYSCSPPYEES